MFIEFVKRLGNQLFFLLSFEEFRKIVFGAGRVKEFQSMFVGGILIFEGIDFDDISGLRDIADRFDLSVDDCVFE